MYSVETVVALLAEAYQVKKLVILKKSLTSLIIAFLINVTGVVHEGIEIAPSLTLIY